MKRSKGSALRRSLEAQVSLEACPCCGFGLPPERELCPDCGEDRRPPGLWQRLLRRPRRRASNCLVLQEARIDQELQRLQDDLAVLLEQRFSLQDRLREASAARRPVAALEQSHAGVESALAQRWGLLGRYLALKYEVWLDRAANRLQMLFARVGASLTADALDKLLGELGGLGTGPIKQVAFSADGHYLLAASENSVVVWDVKRRARAAILPCTAGMMALSPDGRYLVTQWFTGLTIWDLTLRTEIASLEHASTVSCAAFSPDGRYLATGGPRRIKLWDLVAGAEAGALNGHEVGAWRLDFSPTGTWLLAWSEQAVTLWDVRQQAEAYIFLRQKVTAALFHPDGNRLMVGREDGALEVWDLRQREQVWSMQRSPDVSLAGDGSKVGALCFHPDGRRLAVRHASGELRVWDLVRLEVVWRCAGPAGKGGTLQFGGDGRLLVTTQGEDVLAYSLQEGVAAERLEGNEGFVQGLACASRGKLLAAGTAGGAVSLWELGEEARRQADAWSLGERQLVPEPLSRGENARENAGKATREDLKENQEDTLEARSGEGRRRDPSLPESPMPALSTSSSPGRPSRRLAVLRGSSLWVRWSQLPAETPGEPSPHPWTVTRSAFQGLEWLPERLSDPAALSSAEVRRLEAREREYLEDVARLYGHLYLRQAEALGRQVQQLDRSTELIRRLRTLLLELVTRLPGELAGHAALGEVPEPLQALLDELPARALAPIVQGLLTGIEAQVWDLRQADVSSCEVRLRRLKALGELGSAVMQALEELPERCRLGSATMEGRGVVGAALSQLAELEDLVVARKAAASFGSVSPLADEGPLDELRRQREALKSLVEQVSVAAQVEVAQVDQPGAEELGPLLAASRTRLEYLADRELALRSIEDEYQRVRQEADAVADVRRTLSLHGKP